MAKNKNNNVPCITCKNPCSNEIMQDFSNFDKIGRVNGLNFHCAGCENFAKFTRRIIAG